MKPSRIEQSDYCSKFRWGSLNIVSALLRGLRDGLHPAAMARQLGMKRNHIDYYVKKLEKLGFIERRKSVTHACITSVIAMAIGKDPAIQYPIHMLSYQRIPDNIFAERDDHLFRVYFTQARRGLFFRVVPVEARQVELLFSLPRDVYWRLLAERRILDFKTKFLDHIELPTNIRGLMKDSQT